MFDVIGQKDRKKSVKCRTDCGRPETTIPAVNGIETSNFTSAVKLGQA